ncbi:DMT family transporter (plasmid) [Pseudoalteromonas xiamenensis]|nr:DMT family transporter [Pseudoalteromonas xiamenensis]
MLTKSFSAAELTVFFTLVALPLYVFYWIAQGAPEPVWADYLVPACLSGGLAALGSVQYLNALKRGDISKVIPVLCVTPVISGIAGWLVLNEALSWLDWCMVFLIAVGCAIMGTKSLNMRTSGFIPACITALSWGLCIVFDKVALQYATISFHLVFLSVCIVALNWFFLRPNLTIKQSEKLKMVFVGAGIFVGAIVFQLNALQEFHPGIVEATKRGLGVVSALAVGYWVLSEQITRKQLFLCFALVTCVCLLVIDN